MDRQETTFADIKQTKGRMLGVDFSRTHTGLAVSDINRILASGIGYVSADGIKKLLTRWRRRRESIKSLLSSWDCRENWTALKIVRRFVASD